MRRILDSLKEYSFSGKDILDCVEGKTKIVRNTEMHKFKSIYEVVSPYGSAVILYETEPRYGHWVCLILHNNRLLEFFDPYGHGVDEQLKFIDMNFRLKSNQYYPYLSMLIHKSGIPVIVNRKKLQNNYSDISSCGRHVGMRINLKSIPLEDYQSLMEKEQGLDADDKVTFMTAFVK